VRTRELALRNTQSQSVATFPVTRGTLWPKRGSVRLNAAGGEKALEQPGAFSLADAADDLRPVVAGCGFQHAGAVLDPAALGVVGAEDQPANAEEADGLGAHGAGFQGHDKVASRQPGLAAQGGGGAEGEQFGMRRGIVASLDLVAGRGENRAVGGEDDGTDGDLPPRGGGTGGTEGQVHGGVERHEGILMQRHAREKGNRGERAGSAGSPSAFWSGPVMVGTRPAASTRLIPNEQGT
jgi:hypothetical protein